MSKELSTEAMELLRSAPNHIDDCIMHLEGHIKPGMTLKPIDYQWLQECAYVLKAQAERIEELEDE